MRSIARAAEGPVKIEIRARARAGRRTVETPPFEIELKAVAATAHHSRTFVSGIDGSVQYFGVAPMTGGGTGRTEAAAGPGPALVLTLHGAGVEAIGQARAYKPKDWAWIVAATNRRPYGFDWEDWGRLDALEVLAEATHLFAPDPARVYLTGHSMGGHGTWQVGATVPGLWAAIAPSAGWRSFTSYGGGAQYKDPSPVEKMLHRANDPSETTELARNFLHHGVYVLHGDQDDNVPVTEARAMRELLGAFHPDFAYYERPGAGHWWGNECVDWPPLFEFLRAHARPDASRGQARRIRHGQSRHLVEVPLDRDPAAGDGPLLYSRVAVERDAAGRAFKGTTENVAGLAIDLLPWAKAAGAPAVRRAPGEGRLPSKITVELDGSKVEVRAAAAARGGSISPGTTRAGGSTRPRASRRKAPTGPAASKTPSATASSSSMARAAMTPRTSGPSSKARLDAETFWVRGNAGIEILPDTAFDPAKFKDRSVILYGNADTNAAWPRLLAGSPVEVRNGWARVGRSDMPERTTRPTSSGLGPGAMSPRSASSPGRARPAGSRPRPCSISSAAPASPT